MDKNLKFLKTWSVAQFKAEQQVEKIEVLRNESTGKCFMAFGFEKGAVSDRFQRGELTNPVVSQVCNAETGEMFYLLHQQSEGGAEKLAVL
ncbi:MAG: hypothetical protein VB066_02360 [Paludibacter sp.]|nr:hypothetical protein [Paludibacter sp.]